MVEFFSFLKVFTITVGGLLALFMILLALPSSRMRNFLLKIYGWSLYAVTGLLGFYILSPADLIPDIIPLLGQLDDVGAGIVAIITAIMGKCAHGNSIGLIDLKD